MSIKYQLSYIIYKIGGAQGVSLHCTKLPPCVTLLSRLNSSVRWALLFLLLEAENTKAQTGDRTSQMWQVSR